MSDELMEKDLTVLRDYMNDRRGVNVSAERYTVLGEKIRERMASLNAGDAHAYIRILDAAPREASWLVDELTVNVSRFFRNPLVFELLGEQILPRLISDKAKTGNSFIRIWSAGCANGEEPYSLAILARELLSGRDKTPALEIFATDINRTVLENAVIGQYSTQQVREVKYGILTKYFTIRDDTFTLHRDIRENVRFSHYDMTDPRTVSPPESVFGSFDLVMCRNLLIYFDPGRQVRIFNKLDRSLSPGGFLVLGRAETLPAHMETAYQREDGHCNIFSKHHNPPETAL